jgi:hypothetical protein
MKMPMLTEIVGWIPIAHTQEVSSNAPSSDETALGILPSGNCTTVGSAPFCDAHPSDCTAMGRKYCGNAEGTGCIFGNKVICCDSCP